MIIPADNLKISEFCKKAWPKKDAEAPSMTKTVEKPRQNRIKGSKLIFFWFKISCKDWPDIYEIYPGINGRTQGDKKLISPAPKAIKYSNIYPVFFIAAEIPAIDVIKESSKNFLSNFLYFLFVNLFIISACNIFSISV